MRVLAVSAALALVAGLAATPAEAGDFSISVGYHRGHDSHRSVEVHARGHHGHHAHHGHRPRTVVRHVTRRVVRPAPVRVVHVHRAPVRVWIAGHYETRTRQVWVPGYHEKRVEPAAYERRFNTRTCSWEEIQVRPERIVKVWVEGRHEDREERVWVEGYWKIRHR